MEALIYVLIGAGFVGGSVVAKSVPVAIIGAYYVINHPVGKLFAHDKDLWYPAFISLNVLMALYLAFVGDLYLRIAAMAFFASSMWTFATYCGWPLGTRQFAAANYMLFFVVFCATMMHLVSLV